MSLPVRAQSAGAAMMAGATVCWGITGAVSTTFRCQPVGLLALAALGQAAILLVAVRVLGLSRARPRLRLIALSAALDAGVMSCYITALTWAPAGPVAAVHLTAPILLLGWTIARGERRAGGRELAIGLLLVAGIAALALAAAGGGGRHPVGGVLLAALSAVFYATLLRVGSRFGEVGVAYTAGLKWLLMAGVCAPSLLVFSLRPAGIGVNTALIALYLPASLLFWRAVTTTSSTLVGSVGLLEAVFCGLFAWLFFASPVRPVHVAAVVLILAAVLLELRRPVRAPARPLLLVEPGDVEDTLELSAA